MTFWRSASGRPPPCRAAAWPARRSSRSGGRPGPASGRAPARRARTWLVLERVDQGRGPVGAAEQEPAAPATARGRAASASVSTSAVPASGAVLCGDGVDQARRPARASVRGRDQVEQLPRDGRARPARSSTSCRAASSRRGSASLTRPGPAPAAIAAISASMPVERLVAPEARQPDQLRRAAGGQLDRQLLEGDFAGLVEPGRLVLGPAAGQAGEGSPRSRPARRRGSAASRPPASSTGPPRAQCSATRSAIAQHLGRRRALVAGARPAPSGTPRSLCAAAAVAASASQRSSRSPARRAARRPRPSPAASDGG